MRERKKKREKETERERERERGGKGKKRDAKVFWGIGMFTNLKIIALVIQHI